MSLPACVSPKPTRLPVLEALAVLAVACQPANSPGDPAPVRPCAEGPALLVTALVVGSTEVGLRRASGPYPDDPDRIEERSLPEGLLTRRLERTRDAAGRPLRELEDVDGDGQVDREVWWTWRGDVLAERVEASHAGPETFLERLREEAASDTRTSWTVTEGPLERLEVRWSGTDRDGDGRWEVADGDATRTQAGVEQRVSGRARRTVTPTAAGEEDTWRWLPGPPVATWPAAVHVRRVLDAQGRATREILRLAGPDEEVRTDAVQGWVDRHWVGDRLRARTLVRLAPVGVSPYEPLDDHLLDGLDAVDPGRLHVHEETLDEPGRRASLRLSVAWLPDGGDPARALAADGLPALELRVEHTWTRDDEQVVTEHVERTVVGPDAAVLRRETTTWTCEHDADLAKDHLQARWGPPP